MDQKEQKCVSFLELCSEIFKEQNRRDHGQEFRNFYDDQRKHFLEILLAAGIQPKVLKKVEKGAFKIPISQKEVVKALLTDYTSKPMKSFRKGNFEKLNHEHLKSIVEKIDSFILVGTEGADQIHERSKLYLNTRYLLSEAITEVQSSAIDQAVSDIKAMREFVTQDDNCLNDSDKAYLLRYYGQLLTSTTLLWKNIVGIVCELREQELMSISEEELKTTPTGSNADVELHPLELESIEMVVHEAYSIFRGEENLKHKVLSRPKPNELKHAMTVVKELIEMKKTKKVNKDIEESGDVS